MTLLRDTTADLFCLMAMQKKGPPKNDLGILLEHGPEKKFCIIRYGKTAEEK